MEQTKGYCVRCKDKAGRVMKDAHETSFKGKGDTKRRAMTGTCEVCDTKMFKILPNK